MSDPPPFEVTASLQLKNMVSRSCIKLVQLHFSGVKGVRILEAHLGFVKFSYEPRLIKPAEIERQLRELGFPEVKDPEEKLVEEIKIAAIELIHYAYNANSLIRNSDYLSQKLGMSYPKMSKVFSEKTGVTLEKYLIALKIEKVKELLSSEEYTLSEIAFMFGYSSVQYLSNQFKKITGLTVSEFKQQPKAHRKTIEELLPDLI